MTGTNCDLFTHKSSRSYLNHLVLWASSVFVHKTVAWAVVLGTVFSYIILLYLYH